MKDDNNLICIYDDTKENTNKMLLDIYTNFVESELQKLNG